MTKPKRPKRDSITMQCTECGGTGLYHGFMERPGEFVICARCGGVGGYDYKYTPFLGRKRRRGVIRVRAGSGLITDRPGPGGWFSYAEFARRVSKGKR